jgi:hypothetical protein
MFFVVYNYIKGEKCPPTIKHSFSPVGLDDILEGKND